MRSKIKVTQLIVATPKRTKRGMPRKKEKIIGRDDCNIEGDKTSYYFSTQSFILQ